jgi:hypothetical protein
MALNPQPGPHRTVRTYVRLLAGVVQLLALCVLAAAASAETDGPYVIRKGDALEAWSVEATAQGFRASAQPIGKEPVITVGQVGSAPAFKVKLRADAADAPGSVDTRRNAPLFVVADTHGEYEILVQMLRAQHIVDGHLQWAFGRGHLVILGDVFDRGAHQTEILWLLYALEAQAQQAGGGVHVLIGNHEVMALHGEARYLNPKYRQVAASLGVESYAALFAPNTVLGQWLRSKAAVMRINDLLCLHGGISPEVVERDIGLDDINTAIRQSWHPREVHDANDRELIEFLLGQNGPLWYRGYFPDAAGHVEASDEGVERVLKYFEVRKILVGHTRVPTITPLMDGKVVAVQVYPQREDNGTAHFEALWVRGKKFLRALPDGSTQPLDL